MPTISQYQHAALYPSMVENRALKAKTLDRALEHVPFLPKDERVIFAEASVYRTPIPRYYLIEHGKDNGIRNTNTIVNRLIKKGFIENPVKDDRIMVQVPEKYRSKAYGILTHMV